MTMKVVCGVLAAFLLVTVSVWAQDKGAKGTADIMAKLQSQLNLTQDQGTAITPIIEKYISKRKELRVSVQDGSMDKGTMHAQMEQLREDENQELSQVLSQDQMSQWSNMQNHARHGLVTGGSNGA